MEMSVPVMLAQEKRHIIPETSQLGQLYVLDLLSFL